MSARFGDELREKRRSLGLSIQQVANTIKIRPQIVEYFEMGDFASMPPRGYAQGMISSYARYLGLNSREIVNLYLDELYVYERSGEGEPSRFQDPASFVSSRNDASSGRFMIVDGGAPSSSRYAQRPPQAGYVSDSTTGHSSLRVGSNPRRRQALLADASARADESGQRPAGSGDPQRPRRNSSGRPSGSRNRRSQGGSGRRLPEGGRGRQSQYQRSRSNGGSLAPSSRRSGGHPRSGGYGRSRSGVPQRRGQGRGRATSASFLSSMDPRVFWIGTGVIALLLIFLVVGAARGCTSSSAQTETVSQVAGSALTSSKSSSKSSTSSKSSKSSTSTSSSKDSTDDSASADDSVDSSSSDDSSSDNSADGSASTEEVVTRSTTVKISLAKGKTSWIEVKVDGVSQYADTPVGPYEAEYTPTKTISITVDDPSAVTVTENGSKVRWDSKTSGVGRVTITVPQDTSDSSSDSSTTDSQSDSSSDATDDGSSSSSD